MLVYANDMVFLAKNKLLEDIMDTLKRFKKYGNWKYVYRENKNNGI